MRALGTSDLVVSPVALGTATFGVAPLARDVDALVGAALDAGVTYIDCANTYGNQNRFDRPGAPPATQRASAEELVGVALRRGGWRDRVLLASKVGEMVGPAVNDRGLSAEQIIRQCERSLQRLGTDHLDLYYPHHPDPEVPVDETFAAFDRLVRDGKVRHVGLSTYSGWELTEVVSRCEVGGWASPVVDQVFYNLLARQAEADVVPACRRFGMSTVAFSPLAGGLLAGTAVLERATAGFARFGRPTGYRQANLDDALTLETCASRFGTTPAALALGWLLRQPTVASVIVGAEQPTEIAEAVAAAQVQLSDDEWAEVDAIGRPEVAPRL